MKLSTISKNTLALMSSQIYAKFAAAVFFFIAARLLGITNFGIYTLVLTFISFFYILSDWGLSTIIMRDVAKEPEKTEEYLVHSIFLRILLALTAYILLAGTALLLNYSKEIVILLAVAGLSIFPNNILGGFNSIFNAREKMHIPSIMSIIFTTIYLLVGIIFLYFHMGLILLMVLMVTLSLANLLATGWLIKGMIFGVNPVRSKSPQGGCSRAFGRAASNGVEIRIKYPFLKKILKQATPCALLSALSIIYFRVDSVMLSKLSSIESVGLYNAAYRIIEFLMFISGSIMMAYFPEMSRRAKDSIFSLRKNYLKSLFLLLSIILPIVILLFIFAKPLILLLFGAAFLPSVPALKILSWALVFVFINAPFGNILYNSDKALKYVPFAIAHTLLNILLNLIFIPKWGLIGASYVTLITEVVGTFVQVYFIKQIIFCPSKNE